MNQVLRFTPLVSLLTLLPTAAWAASHKRSHPAPPPPTPAPAVEPAVEKSPAPVQEAPAPVQETATPAGQAAAQGDAHPGGPAPAAEQPEKGKEAEEHEPPPFALPGGLRFSGMFDAVYERKGRGSGFDSGKNEFGSYHHFLFVSRQGDDIPVGFNAEVLGQLFYELNTRLTGKNSRLRVSAHAGKILVPFGPDPLFHKPYGGLSGNDQRLLPVVWASYGAGIRVGLAWRGLTVSDELYIVQGFDLRSRDQILNMQRDLMSYDGARIAVGDRLSFSLGPATLWYSFYWNQLRFGRFLVMQALDLAIWRPSLPVLNRLAFGVGVIRAHVSADSKFAQPDEFPGSGGYYHFADYVWLRTYFTDWLYLQARSGLLTFENRAGMSYDSTRATAADGSHHNVALVAEYAGAQLGLAYFWNFEKVDEKPDDMFRLTVSYAF
jgi:hypothetical protein